MNKRGRILGLVIFILLLAGIVYFGLKNNIFADTNTQAINLYVATNGVDTNDGSISAPFKTLTKARDYIRTIKPLTAPVVVNIRAGTYDPTYFTDSNSMSSFSLDTRDSGTANFPITYQAYNSEQVTISGGQKVSGWQKFNDKLYVVDAPSGTPSNFNSLYISGQSAQRARTSTNYASANVDCAADYADKPLCSDKNSIRIPSAYVSPNWTNLSEVELVAFNSFKNPRLKIDSVVARSDGKSDVFTKTDADIGINKVVPPNRYYFDNVFEALDSPGEWYFNKTENKIYYYPKSGEDMNSLDVVAPRISMIMSVFQGSKTGDWSKDENLVHDLNFKNLIFSYTNYNLGSPEKYNGAGHGYYVGFDTTKAAVRVFGANRINFSNNTFSHLGNFGLDAYSKNFQFINNKVFDTGSGGIKIGSLSTDGWPSLDFSSSKIEVKSNTIHDVGKVFKDVSAVHWIPSGNDDISSNTIFNAAYRGLSIYNGASGDNLVAKNEIHDVMQELNDGGAIYTVSRASVTIENNWIHDIKQVSGAQYRTWGINGIYIDEASELKTIRNNLIENVSYGAITLNRSNNNIITNNIVVGDGEANIFMSKFTTTESAVPTGNQIDKNIVITKPSKKAFCLYGSTDCNLSGFAQPLTPIDLVQSTIKSSNNNYFYNVSGASDQTLTAWKSYGFDASSQIGQDPFVDSLAGNYCLKSDSSAKDLGIASIDFTSFGKAACEAVAISPTPTSTVSSPPQPYEPNTSYTFPKGFSILGATKPFETSLVTSGTGLYVYKFDGVNNKWLIAPTDTFTIDPFRSYYVYNPSDPKTISVPFDAFAASSYILTAGWNLLFSPSDKNLNNLNLSYNSSAQSAQMRISANTIHQNIFIIDDTSSSQACTYFKLLGDSDSQASCSTNQLGISSKVPAGKAFWVYAR